MLVTYQDSVALGTKRSCQILLFFSSPNVKEVKCLLHATILIVTLFTQSTYSCLPHPSSVNLHLYLHIYPPLFSSSVPPPVPSTFNLHLYSPPLYPPPLTSTCTPLHLYSSSLLHTQLCDGGSVSRNGTGKENPISLCHRATLHHADNIRPL